MAAVFLVQSDIVWEDKPANHAAVRRLLDIADPAPAAGDLIVLPEMFDTGFSFRLDVTARDPERTTGFLSELARSSGCWVLGGASHRDGPGGRGRNRAHVFGPGGEPAASYDKIHPFSFGREAEFFDGGTEPATFEWRPGDGAGADSAVVGLATCYDLRFPELFRRLVEMGAEGFAVIANWPAARAGHWRTLLRARAIENQAFVIGVNRTGADPHLAYSGDSAAIDAMGETIVDAGSSAGVVRAELDFSVGRAWRERFPAVRDQRL